MAVNDDILDAQIRHETGLHRLANREVNSLLKLLRRVDHRLTERLLKAGGSDLSRKRQKALQTGLNDIIDSAYTDATGNLRVNMDNLAKYEGQYQADLLKNTVPVQLQTVMPSEPQLMAAVRARPFEGKILSEWARKLTADAKSRVANSVKMGFVEGRTITGMIEDLRGTAANGYKDGILEINRRAAEAVVRTAVNHTATIASETFYKANSAILSGVQWVSTLDGRTTAICQARDGEVYDLGKGPRPPAHFNCRSATVPVLKSADELGIKTADAPKGTRASMNGQVAADQNYNGWLRKQSAGFQDELLGKTKAQLFRNGNVNVDRFVNNKGREYTLKELKRREAEGWKKAGLS